jgi:hypothetical protein
MRPTPQARVVALVGSLVVLILVASIVSAVTLQTTGSSTNSQVRAAGTDALALTAPATPTSSTTAAVPSTTPPAVPVPTTSRPPATAPATTRPASPKPTTAPSVAVRSTRNTFGPTPASYLDIPYSPGTTSWAGVSDGVSITVHTDRPSPRVGELITFDIDLSSVSHVCCGVEVSFGDGYRFDQGNSWTCPGPQGHGPVHFTTTHAYNLDGRWTFSVGPISGNCVEPRAMAGLLGVIEIGPGAKAAQGPTPPRVDFFDETLRPAGHESDRSWASMVAWIQDDDGFIVSATIDWGDGTVPQSFGPTADLSTCRPTLEGWPGQGVKSITTGQAVHHYAAPGVYTLTLTGISTGCDGVSDPQRVTATFTWVDSP